MRILLAAAAKRGSYTVYSGNDYRFAIRAAIDSLDPDRSSQWKKDVGRGTSPCQRVSYPTLKYIHKYIHPTLQDQWPIGATSSRLNWL